MVTEPTCTLAALTACQERREVVAWLWTANTPGPRSRPSTGTVRGEITVSSCPHSLQLTFSQE